VKILLRSFQILVAHQFLHHLDVDTSFQEVSSERMAQVVRSRMFVDMR
jgi:hypothetical protein